jgi:hypothetical protein
MQIPKVLNTIGKTLAALLLLITLLILWVWADANDYFHSDYRDLTDDQMSQFRWKDGYDSEGKMLQDAFSSQFNNDKYKFPRQEVSEIKLFYNIPAIGIFTGKRLSQKQAYFVTALFNDPSNFGWGETTWGDWELGNEYLLKFYSRDGAVIGRIEFCGEGCWLTSSRPFSPRMKFRSLSETGRNKLNEVLTELGM